MTLTRYMLGFILSIVLTLTAAGFVATATTLSSNVVAIVLVALALAQFGVQLIYFLHVGHEKKPHYHLTVLTFALIVVCIVVGGTLWIMDNVNRGHEMPDIIEMEASALTPRY